MLERLVERQGGRVSTAHTIGLRLVTIGRAADNEIVVTSDRASRHHAQVSWNGEHYMLKDLGSMNGTFLNGRQVTVPQPLRHGDIITVAGLTLMFDAADETVADAAETPNIAGIRVDVETGEVWSGEHKVAVTAKEFLTLALLYGRDGALVTKEELATHVWPEYQGTVGDASIEQLVFRLRRKLEPDPEHPRHLLTVRGLGYRFIFMPDRMP